MRETADIKAPDGYLLGGERVVRRDGTVLFQRSWWRLPDGFAEPGEYVWVHCRDGYDDFSRVDVAPPGYTHFFDAYRDQAVVQCEAVNRPDAKPGTRDPRRKEWRERMAQVSA